MDTLSDDDIDLVRRSTRYITESVSKPNSRSYTARDSDDSEPSDFSDEDEKFHATAHKRLIREPPPIHHGIPRLFSSRESDDERDNSTALIIEPHSGTVLLSATSDPIALKEAQILDNLNGLNLLKRNIILL